jgi:DNA-binding GntR family transcriptional regulator
LSLAALPLMSPMRVDPKIAQQQIGQALAGARPLDPRASYADQVHAMLRQAIVRGALPPGAALSEAAIAAAVGVSRTPVREALRLLAHGQLVDVFPQAGTVVAPIRIALIREGHFVRRALESANLADLTRTITDAQLRTLQDLVAAQARELKRKRVESFFSLDEQMHRRMFDFTQRGRVWSMIEAAKVHLDRVRWLRLSRVAGDAERALAEHRELMDSLAARNGRRVRSAIQRHIDFVAQILVDARDLAPANYFSD